MKPPTLSHAAAEIAELIAGVLDSPPARIHCPETAAPSLDFFISALGFRFVVEYKTAAAAGQVAYALDQLSRYPAANGGNEVPLLVVPYMGPVGQELCKKSGVSWLDLSGNADIVAPGLRIRIEGRPNKFRDRGRPPNVFASKSSRVARRLLLEPKDFQTQAELARSTGLDDGYVSKIVRRLAQEELVDVNDAGAVRARDPNVMLDAWRDAYDFNRHRIFKGHVPARSGDQLLRSIARRCGRDLMDYAATGLAAASLAAKVGPFQLATFYVQSPPARAWLDEIEFAEESPEANLWLVVPDDDGVFQGGSAHAGVHCVHPVQIYLDLKSQPERSAKEAAVELRWQLLTGQTRGQ